MALRFMDGAELGAVSQKWTGGTDNISYDAGTPRYGSYSIKNKYGDFRNFYVTLDAQATWIVGFAYRTSAIGANNIKLLRIQDAGTDHIYLQQKATTGELEVYNGDGTLLASSGYTISPYVWYYIEFKVTINNTTGSFELKVLGVSQASGTNVDTQNTANATADRIQFEYHGTGSSINFWWDDIYICDGAGALNNDFLGDCRVDALTPTADTAQADFTPQGGGANYVEVDEIVPDDDTTYVYSSTVGHRDLYTMADMPVSGAVFGLQLAWRARKADAGSRSARRVLKSGVTTDLGTSQPLSDTYQTFLEIIETDPNTGSQWSEAGVNAAEIGFEIAA